jgi:outer membrane protein assembly factor BamB
VFAAVDLRSGEAQWTLPVASITTPWPAGDVVYVVSQTGQVICAARGTGQVYWITELNKGLKRKKRAGYFGPVLASGHLLVVSDKGQMVSLDPHTGAVQRTIKLGDGALTPPIAMGDTLYVVTEDASLVAIR